jgi:hypothetical protein
LVEKSTYPVKSLKGLSGLGIIAQQFFGTLFLKKPDRACRTELAVKLRILAFQTFLTQVAMMLHTQKTGLDSGMAGTLAHIFSLLSEVKSQ